MEKQFQLARFIIILLGLSFGSAHAGLHTLPIVLKATDLPVGLRGKILGSYRLFRTDSSGKAIPIPFQIDEKDRYGDYILPKGPQPNTKFSNAIFDFQDEIALMGNDVGPKTPPKNWGPHKPDEIYEVSFSKGSKQGAVYIGIYSKSLRSKPQKARQNYVSFSRSQSTILTSRYRYRFAPNNYLVVNGVEFKNAKYGSYSFIANSSFYLKADLKYFLTMEANEHNVENKLEAYKDGPIRSIARVLFNYKFMALKWDLGMYTEVSFFANSVVLPAVIDNPLDGSKILNKGSEFYYGLALTNNPASMQISSNMPQYGGRQGSGRVNRKYWISAISDRAIVYLEFAPSSKMLRAGNVPKIYLERSPWNAISNRKRDPAPLGQSRVNVALAMGLAKFPEGQHQVKIRLFLDSVKSTNILNEYKTADQWRRQSRRLL